MTPRPPGPPAPPAPPAHWPEMDVPPYAEVCPAGHLTVHVRIIDGITQWGPNGGPFAVWGFTHDHAMRRARSKARKLLDKYVTLQERRHQWQRVDR